MYSRASHLPLLSFAKPTATQLAELVKHTVQRFGPPKHFISDQGSQFTAKDFQRWVRRYGVLHRFGAVGKTGSIAINERLWRSLKETLLKRLQPISQKELQHRLVLGLVYYTYFRPHQGLGGAAPAEVYFGWKPAHHDASNPPRARPRQGPTRCPFSIAFLENEQQLPYLVRKAA